MTAHSQAAIITLTERSSAPLNPLIHHPSKLLALGMPLEVYFDEESHIESYLIPLWNKES